MPLLPRCEGVETVLRLRVILLRKETELLCVVLALHPEIGR